MGGITEATDRVQAMHDVGFLIPCGNDDGNRRCEIWISWVVSPCHGNGEHNHQDGIAAQKHNEKIKEHSGEKGFSQSRDEMIVKTKTESKHPGLLCACASRQVAHVILDDLSSLTLEGKKDIFFCVQYHCV